MRVWPGRPYPLGATWDGAGVNFASSPRTRRRSSSACSTRPEATKEAHRIALPEQTDQVWHGYLPGRHARAALRLPRSRAVRAGRRDIGSIPTRSCSIRTPRRSAATCKWDDALFGYKLGDPEADLSFDERDSAAVRAAGGRRRPRVHLGRRPPAADALAQDAHLRAARQGLHASGMPDVPEKLRGTYAGLGVRGGDPASAATWASRPSSCCRSTITSTTASWSRRGR